MYSHTCEHTHTRTKQTDGNIKSEMNLDNVLSPDDKNRTTEGLFISDSVPSAPEKHWKLTQALGMLEEVSGLVPQGLF